MVKKKKLKNRRVKMGTELISGQEYIWCPDCHIYVPVLHYIDQGIVCPVCGYIILSKLTFIAN